MSRSDFNPGLSKAARAFLNLNEKPRRICECCKRPFPQEEDIIGEYSGFDDYPLIRYHLKDAGYADEYLQLVEWSSGPVMFLGLKVFDKEGELMYNFVWTEREREKWI